MLLPFTFSKQWQRVLLLAAGHGLNDFVAGSMLGNLLYLQHDEWMIAGGFLLYNILAFGGQYFMALLMDRYGALKNFLMAATAGNLLAVLLFPFLPFAALGIAGMASAVYHVAGGIACAEKDKAGPVGLFAAPGIIGLTVAGYLTWQKVDVFPFLIAVCILFIVLLYLCRMQTEANVKNIATKPAIEPPHGHDLFMIVLLAVIALRSALWNLGQIVHDGNYYWLLAIAVSAAAGKVAGGWLSDRVGWKLYSLSSLLLSLPFLTIFKEEIILFCIGISLLQSAIPANTMLIIRYVKGSRSKGIAHSFGTAIIAGIFLVAPLKYLGLSLVSGGLLLLLMAGSFLLFNGRTSLPSFTALAKR
jgi:hypothetical protein